MKIDLTKEEISILNSCLLLECMEIGKNKQNRFIDKSQLEQHEKTVLSLLDKINKNESEAK